MNRDEEAILIEAMRWHEATQDPDMDWTAFTVWLEADPRHGEAYDTVALGTALLGEHRSELESGGAALRGANDDEPEAAPAPRRWARWAGVAIAASLAAVLVLPQVIAPSPVTYATGASSQTIALEDGSSVILAPHSTLAIAGRHQDHIALGGGAWFDIKHDPSRSLEVTAGDIKIGDIGTRFDVQEGAGQVRVKVAEGVVSVSSDALGKPISLPRGSGLTYDAKAGTAIVKAVDSSAVGEWRSGRLSFDTAPLELVAADISRYAGIKVTVAPTLRDRPFTGTLVFGDGEAALRDLAKFMDVDLRRSADGFMLDKRR
ncbi:FecR family protein [Novosphingobium sp.]|uniref:FecR family protein n=1 Tax=Novosphingobium sp. TaxID=1874826 RepID=UPI0035B0CD2E